MKIETPSAFSIPGNNHRVGPMLLAITAQFFIATLAGASCSATSPVTAGHLVELYTSEGCSSCPPADRWLRNLPARDDVVALAFHVDYWDYLGWRDRFADSRFTDRQRAMAARAGSGTVYTPEVALDGREWRRWSSGALLRVLGGRTDSDDPQCRARQSGARKRSCQQRGWCGR